SQDFAGTGDIRLALFGVIDRKGPVDDLLFGAREGDHLFCKLLQGDFRRVADIDGKVVVAEQKAMDAFHQVVYVAKRAGLAAVAEYGKIFPTERLTNKGRQGAAVVEAHSR